MLKVKCNHPFFKDFQRQKRKRLLC